MTPAIRRELTVLRLPAAQVLAGLASLRRNTAPYHHTVERRVDIVARLSSPDRYVDLLARLYGFYEPFEAELDRAVTRWDLPLDVEARRKAPLITRDLAALGIALEAVKGLPQCAWLPRPSSAAATLGCLYVTEGATIGGRIIAREVERRLGFGPRDGASFFHGYGADAGARWATFCSLLAAASRSTAADEAIQAAAVETFLAYDRWLAGEGTC